MNFKSVFFFIAISSNMSMAAAGVLDNQLLSFSGTNSVRGSYKGQLEIRNQDGKLMATRIMTYDSFKFENLTVQEVWTGEAVFESPKNAYIITYKLRQADFLKSVEGLSRTADNFKNKTSVFQNILLNQNNPTIATFLRDKEVFRESISGKTPVGPQPLWQNKRHRVESIAHESSTLLNIASQFLDMQVFDWYHDQPVPRSYSNRKEYQAKKQFMIYDPTDFDFYRAHRDILRVVNKTPDTISLVEDMQRRNAYAPTLNEKMNHFENNMKAFHLNEYGMYSAALFSADGKFQKYILDGDAALWTGMYAAAQAMRYSITREEVALANLKKAVSGLMLLMDITGNPKEFARTVIKYENGMTLPDNLHRGAGAHQDKVWLSTGNNDMYKGLVHGFISAYLVLPAADTAFRQQLLNHMVRLPDLKVAEKTNNKAAAYGLRALVTNNKDDRKKFLKNLFKDNAISTILNIEGNVHIGGIADWSGINLGMVGAVSNILIAKALGENEALYAAREDLMMTWKDMATTKRDFLTIAAYSFAVKEGFKVSKVNEFKDGYSEEELQQAWDNDLKRSIWSLREIPIHRSAYTVTYDRSLSPEWCLSWWPRLPWKSIKDRKPAEYHFQGVDAYPLFEGLALGSNFIWKDPAFAYQGDSNKSVKYTGADYLYSYWMGRFSGLINQQD